MYIIRCILMYASHYMHLQIPICIYKSPHLMHLTLCTSSLFSYNVYLILYIIFFTYPFMHIISCILLYKSPPPMHLIVCISVDASHYITLYYASHASYIMHLSSCISSYTYNLILYISHHASQLMHLMNLILCISYLMQTCEINL